MNQHHYTPKEKYIEQKEQKFDDITFSRRHFVLKNKKIRLAG